MRLNSRHVLQIVLLVGMLAAPALATTAITILSEGMSNADGAPVSSGQFFETSWTSTVAFSDVTISAYLYSSSASDTSATAYLTTRLVLLCYKHEILKMF